eukprot:7387012-Prymnesium_polylepis.1
MGRATDSLGKPPSQNGEARLAQLAAFERDGNLAENVAGADLDAAPHEFRPASDSGSCVHVWAFRSATWSSPGQLVLSSSASSRAPGLCGLQYTLRVALGELEAGGALQVDVSRL